MIFLLLVTCVTIVEQTSINTRVKHSVWLCGYFVDTKKTEILTKKNPHAFLGMIVVN